MLNENKNTDCVSLPSLSSFSVSFSIELPLSTHTEDIKSTVKSIPKRIECDPERKIEIKRKGEGKRKAKHFVYEGELGQ